MKIKIVGKAHLKGTSKKTGNPYDFNQVHYTGPARGVEGLSAQTLSLDPQAYPYDSITLGGEYIVEFDNRGYLVDFQPVGKGKKITTMVGVRLPYSHRQK